MKLGKSTKQYLQSAYLNVDVPAMKCFINTETILTNCPLEKEIREPAPDESNNEDITCDPSPRKVRT